MYALYKVNVWIKSEIDPGTTLEKVIYNIDNLPSGNVDFIADENYITKTEEFIYPTKEATLKVFSDKNELLYSNEIEQ